MNEIKLSLTLPLFFVPIIHQKKKKKQNVGLLKMNLDYIKNVGLFFVPLFHQKKKWIFWIIDLKMFLKQSKFLKTKKKVKLYCNKIINVEIQL